MIEKLILFALGLCLLLTFVSCEGTSRSEREQLLQNLYKTVYAIDDGNFVTTDDSSGVYLVKFHLTEDMPYSTVKIN